MLIIQQLEEMADFSNNEKEVAKYLIHHLSSIQQISINQIAKETYTSASTTTRLSKKLGYAGYKELRNAIVSELQYVNDHFENLDPNFPFQENDSMMTISRNIAHLLSESIMDTLNLLQEDALHRCISLLAQAKRINIYGLTNAIGIAYDFQYAMRTIARDVHIIENSEECPYTVYSTQKDDASIFISYSGENEVLLPYIQELYRKRCPVIVITSIGENSFSRYASVTLHMSTREKLYSKINNYVSKESTSTLLNILFSCIFASDYQNNLKTKLTLSKKIDTKRSSSLMLLSENDDKKS